jgi:hypothetical protein
MLTISIIQILFCLLGLTPVTRDTGRGSSNFDYGPPLLFLFILLSSMPDDPRLLALTVVGFAATLSNSGTSMFDD